MGEQCNCYYEKGTYLCLIKVQRLLQTDQEGYSGLHETDFIWIGNSGI